MLQEAVRVTRRQEAMWRVEGGLSRASQQHFRIKSHAVAYARAMSWSSQSQLFIDDDAGIPVRQTRASMTYPVKLD
jgi:hypothetical protein